MIQDRFDKLLAFLRRLDDAAIPHQLADYREDGVSVIIRTPAEYWEVDFLNDGGVDIERFRTNGHIDDESVLSELFAQCSDEEEPSSHEAPGHHPLGGKAGQIIRRRDPGHDATART